MDKLLQNIVQTSHDKLTTGISAAGQCGKDGGFFDFPTWYQYLKCENGEITFPKVAGSKTGAVDIFSAIPPVALAVLEIALRIAGMAAVIFVIYGGISYVVSQGEPDKIAKSRGTIINALVGLTIAIFASGVVKFLGSRLGGQ